MNENKQLMRSYHQAWSKGNLEELREFLDDDCVTYDLTTGEARDVSFETRACEIWHKSFDDVQIEVQQMIAENDKVTVYWLLKSKHTDDFLEIETTNKNVQVPGIEINRIANGKIVEIWRLSDTASLMQQLGVM